MKQMDTIRNNEWIPTEFDLENMPRVAPKLPTASAEVAGLVYMLDGAQDGYVKSHFYKCEKDNETGLYHWKDLHVGRFSVGNCKNIRINLFDDGESLRLIMAWEDPDDVIVGSEITHWKKTVLVHQVGHMPITVTDGTVVCTCESRNAYATFGAFSMTLSDTGSRKHYFKLFPYSDDDAITNDDQNGRVAGYNYVITGDVHPYTLDSDDNPVYRDYYSRTLNASTGLYEYTLLALSDANFTLGTDGNWEFIKGKAYYAYQNCLLNWSGIKELVKNGVAEDYFPCGTILTLPYHGDYGDMAFEVVDFDNVEPYDANVKFTMTLQSKYLYSWWDHYGVGYVFDTNEKAGALTPDMNRDRAKTYFVGLSVNNALGPTIQAQEGTEYPRIYVESIFVQDHLNENRDTTSDNQSLDARKSTTWSSARSGLYECELPYVSPYGLYLKGKGNVTYGSLRNGVANNGTPVVPPSSCPFKSITYGSDDIVNDGWESVNGQIAKYGVGYFQMSAATGLSPYGPSITYDAVISNANVYKSVLDVSRLQASYGTHQWILTNTTTGAFKNNDVWPSLAYRAMGGLQLSEFTESFAPRANTYADRFAIIYPYKNGDGYSNNRRTWSSSVKYYLPVETCINMGHGVASSKRVLVYDREVYVRDVTRDLSRIATFLQNDSFVVSSALKQYAARATDYLFGRTTSSGFTINLEKVGQDILKFPTFDLRYLPNKKYWKLEYQKIGDDNTKSADGRESTNNAAYFKTSDTKFLSYKEYYTLSGSSFSIDDSVVAGAEVTGTYYERCSRTLLDDTAFYYRKSVQSEKTYFYRVAPEAVKNAANSGVDFYKGVFVEMVAGTDYKIGQLIPSINNIPFYAQQKGKNKASATYADSLWTLGDVDGDGNYVKFTGVPAGNNSDTQTMEKLESDIVTATTSEYNWLSDVGARSQTTTPADGSPIGPCRVTNVYQAAVGSSGQLVEDNSQDYGFRAAAVTEYTNTATTVKFVTGNVYHAINAAGCVIPLTLTTGTQTAQQPKVGNTIASFINAYSASHGYTKIIEGKAGFCWLMWKMPNTERVAYGNHVWCQSNVRSYLNGPFDTSKEYIETADAKFVTSRNYYKYVSGTGYVRLVEAAAASGVDSGHWYKDQSISDWCNTHNAKQPIYVKLDGGIPVGVKLDLNQPAKYWDYGASPIMQYSYNESSKQWEGVYTPGDNWWEPQASVNNGLTYDKLAGMYYNVCIDKGKTDDATVVYKSAAANPKSPTDIYKTPTDNATWTQSEGLSLLPHDNNKTGATALYRTRHRQCRQSFLHGFIDCQYKRSSDIVFDTEKTYYKRNIYGRYEAVSVDHAAAANINPYKCGLYEENPTFKTDLQDAYDFLNAIVPVVNRNGLYGTKEAWDMYPRAGAGAPNYGGTLCVDKVWLMSTNQIAGGTGANNSVYEEWSGANNGRWNTFGVADENRYGFTNQAGHKYALKKWAMCVNNFAVFGGASLNDTRIKYSLTLGQHLVNGYSDSTVAAQYWWLRSAGGAHPSVSMSMWLVMSGRNGWEIPGMPTYINAYWFQPILGQTWLSPLITIG